jgi:TPR repeat protein
MQSYDSKLVRELYAKGWKDHKKFAQLIAYLVPFVESGHLPAIMELARVELVVGNESRSEALIARAEALLDDDDLDGHVELWSAYRAQLGAGSPEEKFAKAVGHITHVAERGNVIAQEMLMMAYLHGTVEVRKDPNNFLKWAKRAAAAGSERAIEEIDKFNQLAKIRPRRDDLP